MPAGRPTLYTPELIDKACEYLEVYEKELKEAIPSIAGLAVYLHISRETVHTWAKDEGKEEFSDICKELMAKQELKLSSKGLTGDFNSTITKLMLTKHNYSDSVKGAIAITEVSHEEWLDGLE